jgi:Ca2+-binding EF-hand superfamily protein
MDKPKTLEECMEALNKMLSPEEQVEFLKMTKDDVGRLHHGFGRWIRNNWGLWEGGELLEHMKSLGFIHPDDMSHSILVEYWNRQHQQPSQLQEDIQYYKEYWEKSKHGS